jgi:cytochrome c-type biogenesis protein CcmH/NrfG
MARREQICVGDAVSTSLLKLAQTLDGQGKVHQALSAYLKLIERYPDSADVHGAINRVLVIAEDFRKKGQFHVAMRVLDRLEEAHVSAERQPA